MIHQISLIVAAILLLLAGLNVGHERVSLGWIGLFFFVASFLVH
jgi:hypothetical protein